MSGTMMSDADTRQERIDYMTRTRNVISGFWAGAILEFAHPLDPDGSYEDHEKAELAGALLVSKVFSFPAYLRRCLAEVWSDLMGQWEQKVPEMLSSIMPSVLGALAPSPAEREQVECAGCGMICFKGDTCPRCGSLVGGVSE